MRAPTIKSLTLTKSLIDTLHAHFQGCIKSFCLCYPLILLLDGRFGAPSDYANLRNFFKEWTEGIEYPCLSKKTVPFRQLEQEKAENIQKPHVWRQGVRRAEIAERKMFIYTALNAQRIDNHDPGAFLDGVQAKAVAKLNEGPKKPGPKRKMAQVAKDLLASDYQQYFIKNAVPFENNVLQWKVSSGLAAQAKPKAPR